MPATMEQVRAYLDQDEPAYGQAAQLGPEALPHLLRLVEEAEPGLAANATHLAGFIDIEGSAAVIERAARYPNRVVRLAAAGALGHLTQIPAGLAIDLLNDQDAGVRNRTLRSLEATRPVGVKAAVKAIADNDPEIALRQRASHIADLLP